MKIDPLGFAVISVVVFASVALSLIPIMILGEAPQRSDIYPMHVETELPIWSVSEVNGTVSILVQWIDGDELRSVVLDQTKDTTHIHLTNGTTRLIRNETIEMVAYGIILEEPRTTRVDWHLYVPESRTNE